MGSILSRLIRLERNLPPLLREIDQSFMQTLEDMGYSLIGRTNNGKRLNYNNQNDFDNSVVKLLTTPELKELAAKFPLAQD